MTVMADKGGSRAGVRSGRERIQKLAQAALNVDVTVDKSVMAPLTATEHAVRGAVNRVRPSAGL